MLVLEIEIRCSGFDGFEWRINEQHDGFYILERQSRSVIVGATHLEFKSSSLPEFSQEEDFYWVVYMRGDQKADDYIWIGSIDEDDFDKLLTGFRLLTNTLYGSTNNEIVVDGNIYRFYK